MPRKHGIETPITDQIRELLDGRITPREAMAALLSREPKPE
jgi:glycerol-3-phosphate dehydrogenase